MEEFQNTPGHMLPVNLQTGPTSERRTDAEIEAALKATKEAQYNYNSFRGKDKRETYAEYTKRVDGLVDFVPLTEEQWRKDTGQKTQSEEILADLGLQGFNVPLYGDPVHAGLYIQEPMHVGLIQDTPLTEEEAAQLSELLGLNVEFPFDPCEVSLDIPVGTTLVPLQTPVLAEPTVVVKEEVSTQE